MWSLSDVEERRLSRSRHPPRGHGAVVRIRPLEDEQRVPGQVGASQEKKDRRMDEKDAIIQKLMDKVM